MDGVIILDKPQGFTSFDAVAVLRGLTKERKVGHTGTLDPMATGVLPLLLGRAAKAADLLPDTDKEYAARFRLGERRDTGDVTGKIVEKKEGLMSREALEQALAGFVGEIWQVPPMYSAVSVNGQRLYQLARQGIEVERPARQVVVSRLELAEYDPAAGEGALRVECSKGTYIRTLIEDVAKAAGSCGTMTALRRVRACGFSEEEALSSGPAEGAGRGRGAGNSVLRPVEALFTEYPAVAVSPAQAVRFSNGGSLDMARLRLPRIALPQGQRLRVFGPGQRFLGLAAADPDQGQLKFVKLFQGAEGTVEDSMRWIETVEDIREEGPCASGAGLL